MNLENRPNRTVMMRIGLACLLAANLSRWFLHPTFRYGESLVDGSVGLLMGVAIACLLLSVRRAPRRC